MAKQKTVRWKRSARRLNTRPDAEVAHDELHRIRDEHGELQATTVVDEARSKKSPIHGCFEWKNTAAAEKYREEQARELMNSIEITLIEVEDDTDESNAIPLTITEASAPAFVSAADGEGYYPIEIAMNDPELKEKILQRAWTDLQAWHRRWKHLREFADVFTVIEKLDKSGS